MPGGAPDFGCPESSDITQDTVLTRNVYERRGGMFAPGLRMACGFSTVAFCHPDDARRVWDLYDRSSNGFAAADAFIEGFRRERERPFPSVSPWEVPASSGQPFSTRGFSRHPILMAHHITMRSTPSPSVPSPGRQARRDRLPSLGAHLRAEAHGASGNAEESCVRTARRHARLLRPGKCLGSLRAAPPCQRGAVPERGDQIRSGRSGTERGSVPGSRSPVPAGMGTGGGRSEARGGPHDARNGAGEQQDVRSDPAAEERFHHLPAPCRTGREIHSLYYSATAE